MSALLIALAVCAWLLAGWYGGAIAFTWLQRGFESLRARDVRVDADFLWLGALLGPVALLASLIVHNRGADLAPQHLLWTKAQAQREIEALAVVNALAGTLRKEEP